MESADPWEYVVAPQQLTKTNAFAYCAGLGRTVVVPESTAEVGVIKSLLPAGNLRAWVGITKVAGGGWVREDGKPLTWEYWQPGEGSGKPGGNLEPDAAMVWQSGWPGTWYDLNNQDRVHYTVCAPTASTPQTTPSTSVSAFGDPHFKNIKNEMFEVRRPGVHTLLSVADGASDVLLHVDASIERVGLECSPLFIQRLGVAGRWLGSMSPLGFSAGAAPPGQAGGAGLRVGNSSALSIEEFISQVPSDMIQLTPPSKEVAAPSAVNKHATLMTATLKLRQGVKMTVSWMSERIPSSHLAPSLWVSVTGLSTVRESISGLLGVDDHFYASTPEEGCAGKGESGLLRLSEEAVAAAASMV